MRPFIQWLTHLDCITHKSRLRSLKHCTYLEILHLTWRDTDVIQEIYELQVRHTVQGNVHECMERIQVFGQKGGEWRFMFIHV